MGDRYTLEVKCTCGYIDNDVWYAPTCGALSWECPKCKKVIDLEKYSGIGAEDCATTEYGIKAIREFKDKNFIAKIENAFENTKGVSKEQWADSMRRELTKQGLKPLSKEEHKKLVKGKKIIFGEE